MVDFTYEERVAALVQLQEHYTRFSDFAYDVITDFMGFDCTDIQLDICDYLQDGPLYRMIQAQRGQAKTTLTAAYGVWRIIHNPATRVLVLSAGGTQADEIGGWIIQIIMGMDILECIRPDRGHGDRTAIDSFDIHWQLKGPEKSPSVACVGITSNLQGKRADLLIPDDIESTKNSQTALQRERLLHLSRDFTSICSTGDIVYLGTPQSVDSMYNSLPSRGFGIRIWPGRYPTNMELSNYGEYLAPLVRKRLEADPSLQTGGGPTGQRGQPVDPMLLPEEFLTRKEIDQGPSYFQLQHMLDTRLADADRFPLKVSNVPLIPMGRGTLPLGVSFVRMPEYLVQFPAGHPLSGKESMFVVANVSKEFAEPPAPYMFVDPSGAGKNGDEFAYAITTAQGSKVFGLKVGGLAGGASDSNMKSIADLAVQYGCTRIGFEKNYGNGIFASVFRPILDAAVIKAGAKPVTVEDVWNSGQKELRIIDTLEPLISSNRLILSLDIVNDDWQTVQKYPTEKRGSYSLFFQMARITRERAALKHDDRLEALAMACLPWVENIKRSEDQDRAAMQREKYRQLLADPLGNGRPHPLYRAKVASVCSRMHFNYRK